MSDERRVCHKCGKAGDIDDGLKVWCSKCWAASVVELRRLVTSPILGEVLRVEVHKIRPGQRIDFSAGA